MPNNRIATAALKNVVPTNQNVGTTPLNHSSHPPSTIRLPAQFTSVTEDTKKKAPTIIITAAINKTVFLMVPTLVL